MFCSTYFAGSAFGAMLTFTTPAVVAGAGGGIGFGSCYFGQSFIQEVIPPVEAGTGGGGMASMYFGQYWPAIYSEETVSPAPLTIHFIVTREWGKTFVADPCVKTFVVDL